MISVEKVNESYFYLDGDLDELQTIVDFFTITSDNYKWDKRYRAGLWDGKVRVFQLRNRLLHQGLLFRLFELIKSQDFEYDFKFLKTNSIRGPKLNDTDIEKTLKEKYQLSFAPHDYQLKSISQAIYDKKCVILSPTASGKSFIIFGLIHYIMKLSKNVKKLLLIVPTVSLVEQMASDFADYDKSGRNFHQYVHPIYSGQSKTSNKPIHVSTWQSMQDFVKNDPKFFEQFQAILVDECHSGTGDSKTTTAIISACTNAEYKIGLSGTLRDAKLNMVILEGLFGKVHKFTSTAQLMERGILAPLKIKSIVLDYSTLTRIGSYKLKYPDEVNYIEKIPERMDFLTKFSTKFNTNVLFMFRKQEFGKELYERFKKANPDKQVFLVYGGTDVKDREEVRKIAEKHSNVIIVASYGVFSTGVNIKNLPNLVIAQTLKSKVTLLQTIGRSLRLHKDKLFATLYDIVDDLCHKSWKNYSYRHFMERSDIYDAEQFNFEIKTVKI